MLRAAIYARYSSDNQREESIEAQIRACREYCQKNGYEVVKIYTDEAKSATTDDRPAFLEMIRDSEQGFFDIVVVHKLDRFARNRYDSAFYKKKLRDNGVKLISVLEPLDDSPESVLLESLLEGLAEYYSKNLAREVMKGMKETALQAKHTGGIPPLGYDVDENKNYVINETEAVIVRKIFDLFLQGYGYGAIAKILNAEGFRTKIGQPFGKNSIYSILTNEKYTGTYVFNKRVGKINGKRNNHKFKSEDEIIRIPNAIPAIIPYEVFKQVQEKMQSRKRSPRLDSKRFYLLTGLLKCGLCGYSYSGNGYKRGRGGKKYPIYACVNRTKNKACSNIPIRQEVIEKAVIDELKKVAFSDDILEALIEKVLKYAKEYTSDTNKELQYLNEKRNEIKAKLDKLLDTFLDNQIDKNLFAHRTNELKAQLEEVENRIAEVESKNFDWLTEKVVRTYLLNLKENLANIDNLDPLELRKVIETYVDEIIIYPDEIKVYLRHIGKLREVLVMGGNGCFGPPPPKNPPSISIPLSTLTLKRIDLYKKYRLG